MKTVNAINVSFKQLNVVKPDGAAKGFQRANPADNHYANANIPANANKRLTEIYKKSVKDMQPFKFMITLTYGKQTTLQQCIRHAQKYLHKHNKKLFGAYYYQGLDFIEGVAFIEDHKSNFTKNDIHIHMLVKDNARYKDFSFEQHKDIFHKAAGKVIDNDGKPVYHPEHIDIQEVRDDGVIDYCFKQIWDENLYRVKFFGEGGFSDSTSE